jgi:hypothetical protein
MLRGGKSRSRKQRGGALGDELKYIEGPNKIMIPYTTEEEKQQILADIAPESAPATVPAQTTEMPVAQPADATSLQSAGGKKRKSKRSMKKGGDMGAGLLTAGTLLLIQAAAKSLLASKKNITGKRGSRKQRGGEVIASQPAAFGGEESSLVQSKLMGGSMCGVPPAPQQGGKKRRSKSQKGGALDTTGDLNTAFSTLNGNMHSVAYDQAALAETQVPPFQVSGAVSQAGGKKRRSKSQKGGALNLSGELEAAFSQAPVAGAIPLGGAHVAPMSPASLTALHPQTGGKKTRRSKKQSGGWAELAEAFQMPTSAPAPMIPSSVLDAIRAQAGGKKTRRSKK